MIPVCCQVINFMLMIICIIVMVMRMIYNMNAEFNLKTVIRLNCMNVHKPVNL